MSVELSNYISTPNVRADHFHLPARGNLALFEGVRLSDGSGSIAYKTRLTVLGHSKVRDIYVVVSSQPNPPAADRLLSNGQIVSVRGVLVFRSTRRVTLYASDRNVQPFGAQILESDRVFVGDERDTDNDGGEAVAQEELEGDSEVDQADPPVPNVGQLFCSFAGLIVGTMKGTRGEGAFWRVQVLRPSEINEPPYEVWYVMAVHCTAAIRQANASPSLGVECRPNEIDSFLRRLAKGMHGFFDGLFQSYGNNLDPEIPEFRLDYSVCDQIVRPIKPLTAGRQQGASGKALTFVDIKSKESSRNGTGQPLTPPNQVRERLGINFVVLTSTN